ncbi:MAG: hypothetical protein FJ267_14635, partial [Planctomycetes bacterium]|nr:hypothetical protein [Planctomycetota bacterium]
MSLSDSNYTTLKDASNVNIAGPYFLDGKLALGPRVLIDTNGQLLSTVVLDGAHSMYATGNVEVDGTALLNLVNVETDITVADNASVGGDLSVSGSTTL